MSAASTCTTESTEDIHPRRGQGCQGSHAYQCIFANASRGALVAAVTGSASLSAAYNLKAFLSSPNVPVRADDGLILLLATLPV